jgi:hypothetical protein
MLGREDEVVDPEPEPGREPLRRSEGGRCRCTAPASVIDPPDSNDCDWLNACA